MFKKESLKLKEKESDLASKGFRSDFKVRI
jgi:hypothetical protein